MAYSLPRLATELQSRWQQQNVFWQQWLNAPRTTGAIAPSSDGLAELMIAALPRGDGLVIELGPGTGAITRHLMKVSPRPQDLMAVEINHHFAAQLASQLPSVDIVVGEAERLSKFVNMAPYSVRAIVSGLPLRNMKPATHYRILREAFRLLYRGGAFVQFTYGPLCPVSDAVLARLGLKATKTGIVWRNMPPATVWRIERT